MVAPPIDRAQTALDAAIQQWSYQPLRSIFSTIAITSVEKKVIYQPPEVYLKPQRFALNWDILQPTPRESAPVKDLKSQFDQAYSHVNSEQPLRLEQTLTLLQDYAWAVASPEAAVSLYDYARTNAALAAAGAAALLIGGDMSGVQDFIYTIAADKATKSLRGRSVYLQLLTDAVAYWVLAQAGMPSTNLLYSGGGRFYVVVPATCEAQIPDWRKALGQFLLNVHNGELYVALGSTPLPSTTADFGAVFRAVNEEVAGDKRRRFAALDTTTLYAALFTPRGHGGNEDDRCLICGFMGRADHFMPVPEKDRNPTNDREPKHCKLCASLIQLGTDLHHAIAIVRIPCAPTLARLSGRVPWDQVLQALGIETQVINGKAKFENSLRTGARIQLIRHDDPTGKLDTLRRTYPQCSFEFRPIVNVTPRHANNEVKSFSDLAAESVKRRPDGTKVGIQRFGVLRMDVDDLGDIFGYSLTNASLARISTLSAALSRFFEGWVGEICRSAEAGNRVYSVYSGGDDLFLVGSWDVLPAIASKIQSDLHSYTGGNRLIHLSGGLTLHSDKFPLYQAATDAHDALDRAKHAPERGETTKNALHFLDQTIGWESFTQVTTLRDQLYDLTQGENAVARALLHTLMELYSQYRAGLKHHARTGQRQLFFGPWIWRGKYQLKRASQRISNATHLSIIHTIDRSLLEGIDQPPHITARFIEQAGFAARWTQLLIRNKGDRNA